MPGLTIAYRRWTMSKPTTSYQPTKTIGCKGNIRKLHKFDAL